MNTWLKGLIAAVIGGAASTGLLAVADPAAADLILVGKRFAIGAIIALLAYLKQSPLPPP